MTTLAVLITLVLALISQELPFLRMERTDINLFPLLARTLEVPQYALVS